MQTSAIYRVVTSITMILALLWLTISAPFVFESQKENAKVSRAILPAEDIPEDSDECNPFGNNTEEKTESGSTTLSEYLQHIDELSHLAGTTPEHNCSHSFSVYVAFHGEMLCPPPNTHLS